MTIIKFELEEEELKFMAMSTQSVAIGPLRKDKRATLLTFANFCEVIHNN